MSSHTLLQHARNQARAETLGSIVLAVKISYTGLGSNSRINVISLIEDLASILKNYSGREMNIETELIVDADLDDLTLLGKGVLAIGVMKEAEKLKEEIRNLREEKEKLKQTK